MLTTQLQAIADSLGSWIDARHVAVLSSLAFLWLLLIHSLMITDVWDETNAILILKSEPVASLGAMEAAVMVWLQQLPLDVYRPLGSSLFMVLGKLFDGDFVLLRYFNAGLLLAAAWLFYAALVKLGCSRMRAVLFFTLSLFSSAALITAGWFANIFDATCLFFLALAIWAYVGRRTYLCCLALTLAIFSKEIYVVALPFLALLVYQDPRRNRRDVLTLALIITGFSLLYWLLRQAAIPLGSSADIHTFSPATFANSSLSFFAGAVFQFSKFSQYGPLFWAGLAVLAGSLVAIRNYPALLTLAVILLLSTGVYWGMFSYQGEAVVTAHNFVGRLYLVPIVLFLFIACRYGHRTSLLALTVAGLVGFVITYIDHRTFHPT